MDGFSLTYPVLMGIIRKGRVVGRAEIVSNVSSLEVFSHFW